MQAALRVGSVCGQFLDPSACSTWPIRLERARVARAGAAVVGEPRAGVAQAYGSSGYRRLATSDVSARTREISAGVSLSSYDRNAAWLSIGRNAVRDSPYRRVQACDRSVRPVPDVAAA